MIRNLHPYCNENGRPGIHGGESVRARTAKT